MPTKKSQMPTKASHMPKKFVGFAAEPCGESGILSRSICDFFGWFAQIPTKQSQMPTKFVAIYDPRDSSIP